MILRLPLAITNLPTTRHYTTLHYTMQFQFVSVAAIVALIASTTAAPIPMDIYQQMQANKQAEIDA